MQPIEAEIPRGIVEYLLNANKPMQRKPGHYWVSDITRCLRQSYFEISSTPPDIEVKEGSNIQHLWILQSGKLLHGLTYAYKWRELDIEKEILLPEIEQVVSLHGRLDMYDHKTETIIDLKTTNSARWQYTSGFIPRQSDIDQIQCYGSLFQSKIRVSNLTLVYADTKEILPMSFKPIDKTKWMEDRLARLHVSIHITKSPPEAELSSACKFCKYAERCAKLPS